MKTAREYVESGKHLPEFIRDFHDQKRIFKLIERLYGRENKPSGIGHDYGVDWISAQIYVIDRFLWYMGQRGYVLRQSRAKVDFKSMQDDLAAMNKEQVDILKQAFTNHPESPESSEAGK